MPTVERWLERNDLTYNQYESFEDTLMKQVSEHIAVAGVLQSFANKVYCSPYWWMWHHYTIPFHYSKHQLIRQGLDLPPGSD